MRCPRHRRGGEHLVRRTGKVFTSSGKRWMAGHTVAHEWLCSCGFTGTSTRAGDLPLLPTAPVIDRAYHEQVIRRLLMDLGRLDPETERRRKAKAFRSAEVLARANGTAMPNTLDELAVMVGLHRRRKASA